MRNILTLFCLLCFLYTAQSQAIYYTNFNVWPDNWVWNGIGNISQTTLDPSNFSGGPPFASGGSNIRFCDGVSGLATLTSPSIPTINRKDIIVGFGIFGSSNNNDPVSIFYSINGGGWTLIATITPIQGWFLWTNNLPAGLNEQAGVRFQFQYNAGNGNCNNNTKNIKIDDFLVGANFNLPVALTAFEATPVPGKRWVDLRWSTASEKDNAYFEIERSSDEGRQYEVIGTAPGAGTTALPQYYTFEDRSAPCGTPMYRLRQVDTDQAYSYSPVRAVRLYCSGARLQPTLVRDRLHIVWDEADTDLTDARWQLLGPTGWVIREGDIAEEAAGLHEISMAGLPEGWYFLRLQSDRYTETLPFIKQ